MKIVVNFKTLENWADRVDALFSEYSREWGFYNNLKNTETPQYESYSRLLNKWSNQVTGIILDKIEGRDKRTRKF